MSDNNFADPLARIRAYLRASSDAAAAGDRQAAILAAEVVGEIVRRDLLSCYRAEQERRQALEVRSHG